jgi:hypothetical protein
VSREREPVCCKPIDSHQATIAVLNAQKSTEASLQRKVSMHAIQLKKDFH